MSVQERVEATAVGRVLISVFLVFTLLGIVVWNLPASQLQHDLLPATRPYVLTVGLDQNWGVFAPDPRQQVINLEARLIYADGSTELWGVPIEDVVFGAYREYRWRKWVESAIADASSGLWRPAALYVARHHYRGGSPPVRVTLVRLFYDLPPPGHGDAHPAFRQFAYYTLDITPALLREPVVP